MIQAIQTDSTIGYLINVFLVFTGAVLIARARHSRPSIKYWILGFVVHGLGLFFNFLNLEFYNNSLITMVVALSGIAVLIMIFAARSEYNEYLKKYGKKSSGNHNSVSIIPLIGIVALDPTMAALLLFIGILLIVSIRWLYIVFKATRTPTSQFFFYTLVCALFVLLGAFLQEIQAPGYEMIGDVLDTVLAVFVFVTGLISSIEEQFIGYSKKLEQANKLEIQRNIRAKEISEQLANAAQNLTANADQITASSENIASSQQEISRGSTSQATAISTTQKQFVQFTEDLTQVKSIVGSINEISDRIRTISTSTNMLALNAAIEAARAGDAGRGFNVVADQVRKLANESHDAVTLSDSKVAEILTILQHQTNSAGDILKSISEISTVAEETSASTEEAAAAAEAQASSMTLIGETSQNLLQLAKSLITNMN